MLCITRKPGQSFTVGPNVTVHITEIAGGQVKIAIKAPLHIKILRDDAKQRTKK